jgi:4-hydroxy-3-methylbut-2-enyl diphosphate reductase IspH
MEVKRLHEHGLVTINHDQLAELHNVKVLLRAHGEPPETYEVAKRNNIEIIDATCPVVLQGKEGPKEPVLIPVNMITKENVADYKGWTAK